MGFILVTNDDGIDSPALVPLIQALEELAPVRTCVPDRERSWIGKAVSRFEEVSVREVERDGVSIMTATGYPADCAQLGIHSLWDEQPDMVVSGVNIGFNHGLAFFCSSGTVGGATEGWIAGLPAIAVSAGVIDGHVDWAGAAARPEARGDWERAATIARDVVATVRERGMPGGADLLSVNFPWGSGPETPREVTRIARVGYDQVFHPLRDGVYQHDFGGMVKRETSLGGSDLVAAMRGVVSITPVRLASSVELSESDQRAYERGSVVE